MNENLITTIVIYLLAAVLTIFIFKYWKTQENVTPKIKRCLFWILIAVVVLVALGCFYIFHFENPNAELTFDNILNVVYEILQLPMFSFAYFMFFIGIIYLFRERRRKKLKGKSVKKEK